MPPKNLDPQRTFVVCGPFYHFFWGSEAGRRNRSIGVFKTAPGGGEARIASGVPASGLGLPRLSGYALGQSAGGDRGAGLGKANGETSQRGWEDNVTHVFLIPIKKLDSQGCQFL